ncbi:MAG: hypothetical protein QM767_08855 [Anaeromyxobacter sp.]
MSEPSQELAPPPLVTALVGPAVRGPRQALEALRFHAATPQAAARPDPAGRFLWGAGQALDAARRVATDPALRRAALWPTLLTVLGCAAVAAWSTWSDLEDPEAQADPLGTLHAFTVAFVALASMPPTLLQRQWGRVALEARRALGFSPGRDTFHGPFVKLVLHESAKALRQAVLVAAGIFPVIVVVRLAGAWEAAVVAGLWTFHWIVIDAFELPSEVLPGERLPAPEPWFARLLRRGGGLFVLLRPLGWTGRIVRRLSRPWHDEVAFTERHPWETAGFAVVMGLILAVPGVGLCFRAAGIAGATALVGRLEER